MSNVNVSSITCCELHIPFRTVFQHASATRAETAALWVQVCDNEGHVGLGEGCPREYVTGESVAGALVFADAQRSTLMRDILDLDALKAWVTHQRSAIDTHPAAWCALEIALLDVLARARGEPIETLLELPPLTGPFVYSGVIGSTGDKQFAATLARYQQLGIQDYKIKLSGNHECDCANIAVLREAKLTPQQVRADANNHWHSTEDAAAYLTSLDFPFHAIEEPLQPGQFDALSSLGHMLDARIVLDESILRIDQLDTLASEPERWIVNIRVSKMGGLLRSLDVVQRCRELGLKIIVGAQVGETSVLTRAALTVVHAAGDIVVAQEGAFGTYLLKTDPCEPVLMFGANGVLDVASIELSTASGLGLISP